MLGCWSHKGEDAGRLSWYGIMFVADGGSSGAGYRYGWNVVTICWSDKAIDMIRPWIVDNGY